MIDFLNLTNYRCTFDYLEIYYVNHNGFKDLIDRFCGTNTPKDFISQHPKMEILFVSDFTKHSNGFLAHYTFLGDSKESMIMMQYKIQLYMYLFSTYEFSFLIFILLPMCK